MTESCEIWDSSNRGGHVIYNPRKPMTAQERASQMWRVHPQDIRNLGFKTREEFYLAHVQQAGLDAARLERSAAMEIVSTWKQEAFFMPCAGVSTEWMDGFHNACVAIEQDLCS